MWHARREIDVWTDWRCHGGNQGDALCSGKAGGEEDKAWIKGQKPKVEDSSSENILIHQLRLPWMVWLIASSRPNVSPANRPSNNFRRRLPSSSLSWIAEFRHRCPAGLFVRAGRRLPQPPIEFVASSLYRQPSLNRRSSPRPAPSPPLYKGGASTVRCLLPHHASSSVCRAVPEQTVVRRRPRASTGLARRAEAPRQLPARTRTPSPPPGGAACNNFATMTPCSSPTRKPPKTCHPR